MRDYKIHNMDIMDFIQWAKENELRYHAIFCDPPYNLSSISKRYSKPDSKPPKEGGKFTRLAQGFMGETWDGFDSPKHFQEWVTEWASGLLDLVPPAGILVAFGGTRSYHRLITGIEDAGWDIYDVCGINTYQWLYGSGFPKAHDISKAIDKEAGVERESVGKHDSPTSKNANRVAMGESWQENPDITIPATEAAKQWNGYKTALKPAYEPFIIARKPFDNYTYAQCAQEFATGALNIDATRIPLADGDDTGRVNKVDVGMFGVANGISTNAQRVNDGLEPLGRYPANQYFVHHLLCDDNSCHEDCQILNLAQQSGDVGGAWSSDYGETSDDKSMFGMQGGKSVKYTDEGTAARFFYNSKAAVWEREAGLDNLPTIDGETLSGGGGTNHEKADAYQARKSKRKNIHPTVKPIDLLEQIAKMICPPIEDARLLVPFSGSGSEMIGGLLGGFSHATGVELTPKYIPIAEARLKWWTRFANYGAAYTHYQQKHSDTQITFFEYLMRLDNNDV